MPQPFKTEGANTFELKPVATTSGITAELKPLTLEIKPLTTDSTVTAEIKPLRSDSSMTVDLKPAVIDLCLTANVGKVPDLCIRQPYQHSVSFSLYGINIWTFSFSGEQKTLVEERPSRPQVALGSAGWTPPKPAPPHGTEPQAAGAGCASA